MCASVSSAWVRVAEPLEALARASAVREKDERRPPAEPPFDAGGDGPVTTGLGDLVLVEVALAPSPAGGLPACAVWFSGSDADGSGSSRGPPLGTWC